MNAALNYCWKEWRAQRGLLIAYSLLVFVALCLGLYLAPRHYWFGEGFGLHAVSWFVTAACIGVIAFVVPNLVRAEFTDKDDQFIRRLPGALKAAFWGKLLFLVLAMVGLPLLGLLVGESYVMLRGGDWNGLFTWDWQGNVSMRTPGILPEMGMALLLVPWIWAVGLWVPGGRLALLGAILLALIIGVGVFAVARQSPNIMEGVAWQPWLWTVPVSGVVAAAVSWLKGRRGGGPLRSARFGLLSLVIMLLPGAMWLGERAWRYHYPDLTNMAAMATVGASPDGRYVLVHAAENTSWRGVAARVDLQTGEVQQVAGVNAAVTPETVVPGSVRGRSTQRFWRVLAGEDNFLLDLQTGEQHSMELGDDYRPVLPADLAALVRSDHRRAAAVSAAGGVQVRCENRQFVFESPAGVVKRVDSPRDFRAFDPVGHGVKVCSDSTWWVYGFADGKVRKVNGEKTFFVGGDRLVSVRLAAKPGSGYEPKIGWVVHHEGGTTEPCEALRGATVLGLLDDQRVLACVLRYEEPPRLFAFRPATQAVQEVAVPQQAYEWGGNWFRVRVVKPLHRYGSLLPRDPEGYVWLQFENGRERRGLRVSVDSLMVDASLPRLDFSFRNQLIRWDDCPRVVYEDGLEIIELDIETREKRTLFRGGSERVRGWAR